MVKGPTNLTPCRICGIIGREMGGIKRAHLAPTEARSIVNPNRGGVARHGAALAMLFEFCILNVSKSIAQLLFQRIYRSVD